MSPIRLSTSAVFDGQDGEGVIMDSSAGRLFTLNPVATAIFIAHLQYDNETDATAYLMERIDAEEETLLRGVQHLLDGLAEAQLLER